MKYLITILTKCVRTTRATATIQTFCGAAIKQQLQQTRKVLANNNKNINTCRLLYSFQLLLLLCLTNVGTAHFYAHYARDNLDAPAVTHTTQLYDSIATNASTTTFTATNFISCAATQLAAHKAAAFKTQQYRQQHRFDNKTNDNNFYSNIAAVGVRRFMRVVCAYMIAFRLVGNFIGSLQHVAWICCLHVKQYFSWFTDIYNKNIKYTNRTSTEVFQQQQLQAEMQQRAAAAAAAAIITACQWNMTAIFLFIKRLFANSEHTQKKTTTRLAATTSTRSSEVLLIMWLLHLVQRPQNEIHQQQQQQQQQQMLYVANNVQQQQNQSSPKKCSQYCGNMYQKKFPQYQQQQQQQHSETTIHNQQQQQKQQFFVYKLLLLQQQRIGLFSIVAVNAHKFQVSCSNISSTATTSRETTARTATTLKMYAYCKQEYRRRRRRRKHKQHGIGCNMLHTQLLQRRIGRIMWQKRRMKQLLQQQKQEKQQQEQQQHQQQTAKTKDTTSCQLTSRKCCRWPWSCCICCNNGGNNSRCSFIDAAALQSNINNVNGNSNDGTNNSNNNNTKSTNYNTRSSNNKIRGQHSACNVSNDCCCCCCCCCHYYYYYYCCYCCCCCCNDSYCHFCCCSCTYVCCHQQPQQQQDDSSTSNTSSNNTNSNSKTMQPDEKCQQQQQKQQQQKQQHQQQQQQHQQHQQQQYNQKAYYQRQHKRQQQQHIFYQQHNCYHRRRRRHFCASYTSLHSCCCCFFKWICWRHHNFRKRVACLCSIKFSQQQYQLFAKYCRLSSKEFPQQAKKSQQQYQPKINVASGNECKSIKDCNIRKRGRRRCCQKLRSLRLQHTSQQYHKHQQQCSGKFVVLQATTTTRPLKKIAKNKETCSTITTAQSAKTALTTTAGYGSTARMLKRLFRSHWVWLMIGLVWLEGPKLTECNAIVDIAYSNVAYSGNNCSSSSSNCTQPAISPLLPQSLAETTFPAKALLKQRLPHRSTKPSHALPDTATALNHERENRQQNDTVRLESIKQQILSKLGLKCKPNVTHPLPKQFIWDTIYRADGISSVSDFDFNDDHRAQQVKLLKYSATAQRKINSRVARAHSPSTFGRGANFINTVDEEVAGDLFDLEEDDEKEEGELDKEEVEGLFLKNSQKHAYNLQKKPFTQSRKYQQQVQQQEKQRNKFYYDMDKTSKTMRKSPESHLHHQGSKHRLAHESLKQKYAAHIQAENELYEPDDYYGSTQEIITFAEKGEMFKKHRLVEFSSPKHEVPEQQLHIRHAEIHIRIEKVPHMLTATDTNRKMRNTKLKLWIFQLMAGDYTQRGFDQVARFSTSLNVEENALGWQKLDMTETVQYWYERSAPNDKLRLLIDCTGCGQFFVLHLFDVYNRTSAPKMPLPQQHEQQQQQQRRKGHNLRRNQLRAAQLLNDSRSTTTKSTDAAEVVHKLRKQRNRYKYWSSSGDLHQQQIFNNYKTQYPVAWNMDNKNNILSKNNENVHTSQQQQQMNAEPISSSEFEHLEDRLNPNRPFLVLHTEPKRARRVRRRVIDCAGALHGQCCKESFYVSFKALGWDDWIIAPRGYFANYCRGDCSGPYRTPDTFQTFHAHFIEEYRKLGLLNGMQPCCAPVKFSSMSLIYYGDDGIIKRDLPKMVVDECGCP